MKKEIKIKDRPEPVSISGTRKILNQMINCICKIKMEGASGTGFFCKIPLGNNQTMNCLLTNYHIINEKYYNENKNKTINLLLNDDEEIKKIKIGIKRETYFNKDFDITIIELKQNDNIQNFLELDDSLFKDNETILFTDKSIYLPQYPNGKNAVVSYGLLTGFSSFHIKHTCSTDNGSSGSPILNLGTNKVIGIHKEGSCIFNFNNGTFLKFPLNDFIQNINNKQNMNNDINFQNNNVLTNNNQFSLINNMNSLNINNNDNLMGMNEFNIVNTNMNNLGEEIYDDINKPGPKLNIIFNTGYDNSTILILNYGTTVDDMLLRYLKKINKTELYGANKKIAFIYNVKNIQFGDKTPIEIFFKQRRTPKIQVSFY